MGNDPSVLRRWFALFCWAYLVWVILTWTRTTEQMVVGAVLAAVAAVACAAMGPVAAPWSLLQPRRLAIVARLSGWAAIEVVRANLSLSRRIWSPSRPLRPGMVIVPTEMRSDWGLTAVGLVTSLIVDNQIVDVDCARHELQYHGVWITSAEAQENRRRMSGPVEDYLGPLERSHPKRRHPKRRRP
jgi:multicomponent Na+:H+ antiporter subunit E